jgi:ABC-2 type transport system permease protein
VNRILTVARKEFLQLRRDRRTLPMIIGMPIIQLLVFGYAANMDLRDVRLGLVDQARTPLARDIGRALTASGVFKVFPAPDRQAIEESMLEADAKVGLVIPAGFDRNLLSGRASGLEVYADGSEPNTAVVAAGYVQRIVGRVLADRFAGRIPNAAQSGARLVPRVLYNPDLRSRNYMIPGVVVLILMLMTTIMTAMAIVREYERGTIEQLAVTPVRPHELLAGKLLPYILIGYADVLLATTVGTALFRVPVQGSVPLLFVLAGPFLLATLGLGILTSTIARTQQQAMMLSFLTLMPNILLSGYMFPIENMPLPAQYLTRIIPARYFMSIARSIFLKGTGLEVLWPDALALLLLGAVIFGIAVARYRTRRT